MGAERHVLLCVTSDCNLHCNCVAQICLCCCSSMQTLHAGASMININDAQEDEFVRLNLLYAGTFGETYT